MNSLDGNIPAYIRLNPPIPVKVLEPWMLVEESAIPTAHVSVADHPSFAHTDSAQVLQAVHESSLVDPVGQGPVLFRHNFVVAFGRSEVLRSGLSSHQLCSFGAECIDIP